MIVLITLVFLLFMFYFIKETKKPVNFPPGPPWLPIVGSFPQLKKLSKSLRGQHHALPALAKQYNTNVLGLKLGNEYVVSVSSYLPVREVLLNEEYEGRPQNFFLKLRCMGKVNGITATEGEMWSIQRNFVNRHLRILGFGKNVMEEMIQNEVAELLSILQSNGSKIDVDTFLAPSVLNVLWTLVTGKRIPRDSIQLAELLDLFKIRTKAFDMTGGTLSVYPWLRHILPGWSGYSLITKVNAKLKDLFTKTIREHEQTWEEGKDDDLIYRYISQMRTNKSPKDFTEHQLVMICLDLFIAGAQTTSGQLNFIILMMVMYPDVQKKLQEQIDSIFKKDHNIQYSERYKVPYVQAVILEAMRLCYVIPIIGPRRTFKDTVTDGYKIPKDTTILIDLNSIHKNEEHWKNPETFLPERFLDKNGSIVKSDKLIPFGLGRRRCLGEVLAKSFMFIVFTEIMRKYSVSPAPGSQRPTGKIVPGITLTPEPYAVQFTERLVK